MRVFGKKLYELDVGYPYFLLTKTLCTVPCVSIQVLNINSKPVFKSITHTNWNRTLIIIGGKV